MKNILFCIAIFFFALLHISAYKNKPVTKEKTGTVKITFINTVKGTPVELNTGSYTNSFDEIYSISKFKYYISHTSFLFLGGSFNDDDNYYLIDESKPDALSFSLRLPAEKYLSLSFLLGVDSLKNVSGAQTDALDPLNDMFWTWNSGYIMTKIEGKSPQSKVVNNKIEFHIGGFSGLNNVLKTISLSFPANMPLYITEGKTSEIIIEADIDTWWQSPNNLKITEHPVCTTPGTLAKQFADNYSKMFSIKKIINH